MPNTNALPEVEGLFTAPGDDGRVQLVTATCTECSSVFFPKHAELHKPGCSGGPVEESLLSRRGTLSSWTIQHYQPPTPYPTPEHWEAVAIGTAAFPEGLQIPAQLIGVTVDQLAVGVEVETVAAPLYVDDEGVNRLTWKFRPTGSASENGAA